MVTQNHMFYFIRATEENFQPALTFFPNHIISAFVKIGLPVNTGRGVNIGCDMFLQRF